MRRDRNKKTPALLLGFHIGGEGGIRTLDTLLTYTHFPGVRLHPLGHLSNKLFQISDVVAYLRRANFNGFTDVWQLSGKDCMKNYSKPAHPGDWLNILAMLVGICHPLTENSHADESRAIHPTAH